MQTLYFLFTSYTGGLYLLRPYQIFLIHLFFNYIFTLLYSCILDAQRMTLYLLIQVELQPMDMFLFITKLNACLYFPENCEMLPFDEFVYQYSQIDFLVKDVYLSKILLGHLHLIICNCPFCVCLCPDMSLA